MIYYIPACIGDIPRSPSRGLMDVLLGDVKLPGRIPDKVDGERAREFFRAI